MLDNIHISDIPIGSYVRSNVSLVAIWCTNALSLNHFVIDELLPKWKLKLLGSWYWVKVGF